MRRIELSSLLPPSQLSSSSRSDVLRELAATTSLGVINNPDISGLGSASSLSGSLQEPVKDITEQITELARQTNSLNTTQIAHVGATQDNTQAVTSNTTAKSGNSAASVASTVGSVADG